MKDIIIIGTGKAGYLHSNAYKKIKEKGNVYYVDITLKINNANIETDKVYRTIKDVIVENKISVNNVIVDLCVPKEEFYNLIEQCVNMNIYNIIVEKPFIATKNLFLKYKKLNIVMVQNYLYSIITEDMINFIKNNNSKIELIYSNFSKNRIKDSMRRRGMINNITQNFEVEMPHQIYLLEEILKDLSKLKILEKEQKDYKTFNIKLEKHGYGLLILENDKCKIILESDLCTENVIKEIKIICDKGISIIAKYIIYDEALNVLKDGNLTIKKYNEIIFQKKYSTDDNMYTCLKEYYEYFNNNKIDEKYKNRIIDFSNAFKSILKN